MRTKFSILLVGLLMCCNASAQALTNPTHFVDTVWNLTDPNGYNSIEVTITPEIEEEPLTDGYYFANTVYFKNYTGNNFGGAYAGFQTNGYNGSTFIGKMALFSVWDVSTGIGEAGGWGTPFGGEGTGYSVRIAYPWQVGRSYRLKIYIEQDAAVGDRLWAASLTDATTGITTRIGRINIPVSRGKIYSPVTFHERYMGPTTSCSAVKKSQVSFTNMTANNGALSATSWSNYYIAATPECPGLAWVNNLTGGVQSGIATPKPTAAPAPAPTPAQPTSPAPAPAPAPTPSQPAAPVQPPQVPQETQQAPQLEPAQQAPVTEPEPSLTVAAKANTKNIAIGVSASVLGLGAAAVLLRTHLTRKNFKRYMQKHFPYDPDHR